MSVARDRMLRVNEAQRAYYDATDGGTVSEVNSPATNLWRRLRHRMLSSVSVAARNQLYDIHKEWLGNLSGAKVLELGSGSGSMLSVYLAGACREYHAIDLSQAQIDVLAGHLQGYGNTTFHVGDFLADDFAPADFDIIYAQSVLHHFEYIDVALDRVLEKLAPGGKVITLDPVQSWWGARLVRAAFRPFQTDAAWEFPFTSTAMRKIETRFTVEQCLALYRKAKWALALGLVSPKRGAQYGDDWFDEDLSQFAGPAERRRALQVSFCLRAP